MGHEADLDKREEKLRVMENCSNPVHSDFLVHWTGCDIDREYHSDWFASTYSLTNTQTTALYLDRLKNILRHGIWLNRAEEDSRLNHNVGRPNPPRACFTELKLSQVRLHAAKFGRLGIGFKRFFLIENMGIPMVYFPAERETWFFPNHLNREYEETDYFSCFLKPMFEMRGVEGLKYSFYDESEWRIIFSPEIAAHLIERNQEQITRRFIRGDEYEDPDFLDYLRRNNIKTRPEYILKLRYPERWLSLIIYPSTAVKVAAAKDPELSDLISKLKPDYPDSEYDLNNPLQYEMHCRPIEIDLDACRNF